MLATLADVKQGGCCGRANVIVPEKAGKGRLLYRRRSWGQSTRFVRVNGVGALAVVERIPWLNACACYGTNDARLRKRV